MTGLSRGGGAQPQQVWGVIDAFVQTCGPQVRFDRRAVGESAYEVAVITPVTTGAATVEVLVSEVEVIVCIGVGGRYELGVDAEDARILAALLAAVAAGGYLEDVGGAVRFQATLADGSTMGGSSWDLFGPLRWRRRRAAYERY